jgi:aminoglycoside 6'-N-acetyltransferase I
MSSRVRLLSKHDLKEAAKIFTNVFSSNPWNEPWSNETSYQRLLDISNTPGFIGIGHFNSEDKLIGFLVGNTEQWANNKTFYINEICVQPHIQQKGIGTSLLQLLKETLQNHQINTVYLSTERGQGKPEEFFMKNGYITNDSRIIMTMIIF